MRPTEEKWPQAQGEQPPSIVDENFRFDALVETESDEGLYRDHRLGFEMELRGTDWTIRNQTDNLQVAPHGNVVHWIRPGQEVVLMALAAVHPGQGSRWASDLLRQHQHTIMADASEFPKPTRQRLPGFLATSSPGRPTAAASRA